MASWVFYEEPALYVVDSRGAERWKISGEKGMSKRTTGQEREREHGYLGMREDAQVHWQVSGRHPHRYTKCGVAQNAVHLISAAAA